LALVQVAGVISDLTRNVELMNEHLEKVLNPGIDETRKLARTLEAFEKQANGSVEQERKRHKAS